MTMTEFYETIWSCWSMYFVYFSTCHGSQMVFDNMMKRNKTKGTCLRLSAYCLFKPRAVTVKAVNITTQTNNTWEGWVEEIGRKEKEEGSVFVFHGINLNTFNLWCDWHLGGTLSEPLLKAKEWHNTFPDGIMKKTDRYPHPRALIFFAHPLLLRKGRGVKPS